MNLEKCLVIAGVPGVHKLVSTRSNGLVIEDRLEKRTRFVPVRQHQITPLGTVAVYVDTDEGTVPLADVFQKMLDQLETNPPASVTASSNELRAYFAQILPDHDRDRVHINDIKKCIKWFNFMRERGIFEEAMRDAETDAATTTEPAPEADAAATTEPAPETGETEKSETA